MTSFLRAAIESHAEQNAEPKKELETEYSYFIELSDDELSTFLEQASEYRFNVFSESKLKTDDSYAGKARIRHYINNESDDKYEFTVKTHKGGKSKLEENNDIGADGYDVLLSNAVSTVIRTRYYIPVIKTDGSHVNKGDGTVLEWEVDLYIDARPGANGIHPWAKIELEVDNATLDDVKNLIPIKYSRVIDSDTNDVFEREHINTLYHDEYNVHGKFDRDALSEHMKT